MRDENTILALLEIRQKLDERGIPLKVCASKAGVGYSTFLSWFPAAGTAQIPSLSALPGLAKALPGDLMSLLIPDGFHLVPGPEGIDYDEFSAGCRDFVNAKEEAHHPLSEAGRDIGPTERAALDGKVVRLRVVAA
jgi:hypothetical protein